MIKTGIDLTQYKMVSLSGRVGIGKSFLMGLFIDELTSIGKNAYFINSSGGPLHFDKNQINVKCFNCRLPDDIIIIYEQLNIIGDEYYVFIDDMNSIYFGHTLGPLNVHYKEFLTKLKSFENIKTIFCYNRNKYNYNIKNLKYTNTQVIFRNISDLDINVTSKDIDSDLNIYLNSVHLCKLSELIQDPKIRSRDRKISKLID